MPKPEHNSFWKPPKEVRVALNRGERKVKEALKRQTEANDARRSK